MGKPKKRDNKRKEPLFNPNESFIDKFSGKYTQTLIAGLLFLSILIILTIALFNYEKFAGTIISGMLTALGSFGGFIAGKKIEK
jgi:hypothetical protein